MFEWGYLTSAINDAEPTVYRCNGVEVARLCRKVTGEWYALLNQQRPMQPRIVRECSSFESGRRGVELWAERHRERLQADVDKINALRRERRARIGR